MMLEEHLQQRREVGLRQEPAPLGGRPACEPGNSVRREGETDKEGPELGLEGKEFRDRPWVSSIIMSYKNEIVLRSL